ncbi:hypothetical protein OIU84_016993 [Salix udensis]|uniref:Uncharacterized protein n=1 Tax=Salix udensis TaxID=889485 RepID=A0AAD6NPN7_9ROSI|nr:hypothetical protein OIU84_016993 [Salix udensis]
MNPLIYAAQLLLLGVGRWACFYWTRGWSRYCCSQAVEGIARQPEAEGKIRGTFLLSPAFYGSFNN